MKNERSLEQLSAVVKQLEQQALVSNQIRATFTDRVSDMNRLRTISAECATLDDKISTTERIIQKLVSEESATRELVESLNRSTEELQREKDKLDEDCQDLEKRTKSLLSIEGLSLGEKEAHLANIKRGISEAHKEKERLHTEVISYNQDGKEKGRIQDPF